MLVKGIDISPVISYLNSVVGVEKYLTFVTMMSYEAQLLVKLQETQKTQALKLQESERVREYNQKSKEFLKSFKSNQSANHHSVESTQKADDSNKISESTNDDIKLLLDKHSPSQRNRLSR